MRNGRAVYGIYKASVTCVLPNVAVSQGLLFLSLIVYWPTEMETFI